MVLHRCMLVLTALLLVCELVISHLCRSLIIMVDGFHTLFILMHMAVPLLQNESAKGASDESQLLSVNPSPSPPGTSASTDSSIKPEPGVRSATCDPEVTSSTSSAPPPALDPSPVHASVSQAKSNQLFPPVSSSVAPKTLQSPPASSCGFSYMHMRAETVEAMISALLLASLCVSYCIKILNSVMQPQPTQRPLMATVVGAVSVLHKLLVLGLSWGQLLNLRAGAAWEAESRGASRKAPTVRAEEEAKHHAVQGRAVDDVSQVPSAMDGSLYNGALVLCNPGTSSVPHSNSPSQTQNPPPGGPLGGGPCHQAVTDCVDSARPGSDRQEREKVCKCEAYPHDELTETSKSSTCVGHFDNQNPPQTSSVYTHNMKSSWPRAWWSDCLSSFVSVAQALVSSILALISGLVMLLVGPECLHSSQLCSFLIYLDPGLSLLAVIALLATALPQVYKYGLLLLQATPPQICVSDLGQRIVSVPGVQSLHDLHIWQLTETCMVASVHVHCHAEFQTHR
ncbi:zinc transporter 10 [Myripristis murdjan]|uniref:zinc transporter 10 n=1 Tax=Myripristis murdjan TaxID=586833 RepID=UPI0011760DA1|nr:zinc transporter 10-like [Myripristis murdjan]